jgi:hypothetical protein
VVYKTSLRFTKLGGSAEKKSAIFFNMRVLHISRFLWVAPSPSFCPFHQRLNWSKAWWRAKPRRRPGGPFLTSPLAPPRGKICPLGGMFTPSFTPRGEHSLVFRRMEGWTENFTPKGTKFTPGGQLRPWWLKFARRGKWASELWSSRGLLLNSPPGSR